MSLYAGSSSSVSTQPTSNGNDVHAMAMMVFISHLPVCDDRTHHLESRSIARVRRDRFFGYLDNAATRRRTRVIATHMSSSPEPVGRSACRRLVRRPTILQHQVMQQLAAVALCRTKRGHSEDVTALR